MTHFIQITEYVRTVLAARSEDRDDTGATAVEYGLLVALIAAFIVGVVATLGTEIQAAFQAVITAIPGGAP